MNITYPGRYPDQHQYKRRTKQLSVTLTRSLTIDMSMTFYELYDAPLSYLEVATYWFNLIIL